MSTSTRQIWFTPWCSVDREYQVGPVRVVPGHEVLDATTPDEHRSLSTMFRAYRDLDADPVATPAVYVRRAGPLECLTEVEVSEIFDAASVAAFFALAGNDYLRKYGSEPFNVSHYTLIGANFEPGRTGAAFSGRRRNGSVRDGGYDYATLQLRCPVEASPQRHIVADSPFRDAMNARWDSDLGRQLRRAIWWFTRANTDSPTVPQQAEVKMMGTAFEVLTAPQGMAKAAPIRDAIGDLLAFDWVSCPGWRARAKRHDEAQVQPWTTFQFWWNDFYRLRNAIEHEGHDTGEVPADCPRWNAFQHLMVATIVFPHLVRAVLARDGADPCDGEEVRRLQALEGLLLQPGFRWNGNEKFEDLVKAAEERWFRIAISGAIHKHMPPTRTTS